MKIITENNNLSQIKTYLLNRSNQIIDHIIHYETRDSISLISYAGFLSQSAVISAKIHFLSTRCSPKSRKIHWNPYFWGSRWFNKVINVGTPGKLVSSACYDTQQVCVYLQPFSC